MTSIKNFENNLWSISKHKVNGDFYQIYTKVSQNLPKILENPSKLTKNNEKSFKIDQNSI